MTLLGLSGGTATSTPDVESVAFFVPGPSYPVCDRLRRDVPLSARRGPQVVALVSALLFLVGLPVGYILLERYSYVALPVGGDPLRRHLDVPAARRGRR